MCNHNDPLKLDLAGPFEVKMKPLTKEQIAKTERALSNQCKRQKELELFEIQKRRVQAGIPCKLTLNLKVALETPLSHGWRQRLEMLTEKIGSGFLYSLIGGYGVGKSQLGAALVYKACGSRTALYIRASDLCDTIKDVFRSDEGSSLRQQLGKFIAPKLLVIDEVNEGLSEADIRYIHRVVCQRHDDVTDTLLISNETESVFASLIGDRILSRMIESGGNMEVNWPSFRKPSMKGRYS